MYSFLQLSTQTPRCFPSLNWAYELVHTLLRWVQHSLRPPSQQPDLVLLGLQAIVHVLGVLVLQRPSCCGQEPSDPVASRQEHRVVFPKRHSRLLKPPTEHTTTLLHPEMCGMVESCTLVTVLSHFQGCEFCSGRWTFVLTTPELFSTLKFRRGKDVTTLSFTPLPSVADKLQDSHCSPCHTKHL